MKRIICVLLTVILSFLCMNVESIMANNNDSFKLYNIPITANESNKNFIIGYYNNTDWYFSLEDICELTRTTCDIRDNSILLNQGVLNITLDKNTNTICIGEEKTDFEIIEYNNNYLVKPYALLKLLCAHCSYSQENNSLLIIMPSITTYEAISSNDLSKLYLNIYENDEFTTIVRMSCSIFMDLFFDGLGNFVSKEASEWFEKALFEINKVNIYDYLTEEQLENNIEKNIEIYNILSNIYNIESKSIEEIEEIVKQLNLKSSDCISKYTNLLSGLSDIGEQFAFFSNIVISTEDKLNYNMDSYEIFKKTLTEENLKDIPGDYSLLIERSRSLSDKINSAFSAYYNSTLDEAKKTLLDKSISHIIEQIEKLNKSSSISEFFLAYDISVSINKIFLHDLFKAYEADLNAIYLSEFQNDICTPINYMYDNIKRGFWNENDTKRFIEMICLYDRISIAMFSNLIQSNKEFNMGYDNNQLNVLCNEAATGAYNLYACEPEKDICSLEDFKNYYIKDISKLIDISNCEEYIEFNNWHLTPTIEAEDIINSDEDSHRFGKNQNWHYPSDEYSVIKQNGKYGIIRYDGTYFAESTYERGGFANWETHLYVGNNYPEVCSFDEIQEIAMFPGETQIEIDNYMGGRGAMEHKYLYNKEDEKIYYIVYVSDKAQLLSNSDESSKYYNDRNVFIAEQYDFDITKLENQKIYEVFFEPTKFGISSTTELLVPCVYNNGCMNGCGNIVALEKNGKWGFFNEKGEQIIDFICEPMNNKKLFSDWSPYGYIYNQSKYPYLATEGYIPVKINGKCGYYDTQGNEVIPCGTFEDVRPVHNGLAWVKKDGKWGVIQLSETGQKSSQNEKWQQLYAEKLKDFLYSDECKSDPMFDLYDINDDGIPELFISPGTMVSEITSIYTINAKSLIEIGTLNRYNKYSSSKHILYSYDLSAGSLIFNYSKLENVSLNKLIGGCSNTEIDYYMLNGQNVTAKRYNEELSKYSSDDYVEVGRKYKLDEATINSVLLNKEVKTILFTGTVNTKTDPLNVRKKPSTEAEIIGKLEKGSIVSVYSETNGWYEIKYNGNKGYVSKDYISINGDTSANQQSNISDNEILKAVNKYLDENKGHMGVWFTSNDNPYCPAEYMYSNDTKWSCPINLSW